MADERSGAPISVSIDVGAKAEITTEIPAASSGRLLDALTDIIRPFSEARGLRADRIRLQREDVLIEIAKRARQRLEMENVEISSIPAKTLVPLLEQASLEDPDDDEMLQRWANLLALEASEPGANRRWCIDILSSIGALEAQLLDDIYYEHSERFAFSLENYTARAAEEDFEDLLRQASLSPPDELPQTLSAYDGMTILFHGDDVPSTNEFSLRDFSLGLSLLQLQSLGLAWVNASSFLQGDVRCFVINSKLTPLGFEFVKICKGNNTDE